jgi:subtilisin family serine protease
LTGGESDPSLLGLPLDLVELRHWDLRAVDVAVVDSGIDATHPILEGRVAAAYHYDPHAETPEPLDGPTQENNDVFGHGTAVGSIIAELAPNARLIDVRVLRPGNQGVGDVLVAGLRHAIELGCPVINMSIAASAKLARQLQPLLETAYRSGQVVVASTRNMPLVDYGFPAELSGTISVDSMSTPRLLDLLYRGRTHVIEFAACGEELEVAVAGGGYRRVTGTSFATPVVAAVCALLLGAKPDLRPFEIRTLLKAYSERTDPEPEPS